jgi:hypothetical protein
VLSEENGELEADGDRPDVCKFLQLIHDLLPAKLELLLLLVLEVVILISAFHLHIVGPLYTPVLAQLESLLFLFVAEADPYLHLANFGAKVVHHRLEDSGADVDGIGLVAIFGFFLQHV